MRAPILRGIGEHVAAIVSTPLTIPLPPANTGDIQLVYIQGNSFDVADATPETPDGWVSIGGDDSGQFFDVLFARRVIGSVSSTLTLQPHPDITSTITVWDGVGLSITRVTQDSTWFDGNTIFGSALIEGQETMVMPSPSWTADGRLMISGIVQQVAGEDGPPSNLTVTEGQGETQTPLDVVASIWTTRYTPITSIAEIGPLIISADITETTRVFTGFRISIIGVEDATLPAVPQPERLSLDCARDYNVWITTGDYRTRIDTVGFTDLKWGRILDEPSAAEVTIPDILGGVRCCIPHRGMRPWAFGVLIERNDTEVWSGAVTTVSRDRRNGTTRLGCGDLAVRYEKRYSTRSSIIDWKGTDAGVAFAELINTHAFLSSDQWYQPAPTVFTGSAITRRLLPRRFEMAAAILNELADSAVDYFVMNGIIYIWEPGVGWVYADGFLPPSGDTVRTYDRVLPGPYNDTYDLVYGLFTDEAFAEPPNWGMNGMQQGNFVSVPSTDSGEFGFRNVFFAENAESQADVGVLDVVDPNSLDLPEDAPPAEIQTALAQRAVSYIALHAFAPLTLEGGVLKEGAPIDIPNLIPGSIWAIDLDDHCYGRTVGIARLKSVQVSVQIRDGVLAETVSPTLYPPGFRDTDE